MDSEKFLTVLYAQETNPSICKDLVPYQSPTEDQLRQMPRVPQVGEFCFTHTLALKIGYGYEKDPASFQSTRNLTGVDLMVCRRWRFRNGVFENDEVVVWPGVPQGNDVLIYDPNWPWMQLVIPKPDVRKIRRLMAGNLIGEPSAEDILRDHHDWDGKYTWQPGEFRIEMRSLQEDIKDTRSPMQRYYEERFERDRQKWQRRTEERQRRECGGLVRAPFQNGPDATGDWRDRNLALLGADAAIAAPESPLALKSGDMLAGTGQAVESDIFKVIDEIIDAEFEDLPASDKRGGDDGAE
jgi:hypothetical protein